MVEPVFRHWTQMDSILIEWLTRQFAPACGRLINSAKHGPAVRTTSGYFSGYAASLAAKLLSTIDTAHHVHLLRP